MANPTVVRIVVCGWTWEDGQRNNIKNAAGFLLQAFRSNKWPDEPATFTVTPGGFIRVPFPKIGVCGGWGSEANFHRLCDAGRDAVKKCLTDKVMKKARQRTKFLTLGVDLNDTGQKASDETHAEMVAVVNTANGKIHWTGKSYPVTWQERKLVPAPLDTHLWRGEGERVLVLGCHDLNLFSARSYASQHEGSNKRKVTDKVRQMVKQFDPTVVLHHPHTTYSPRIWQVAWSGVCKQLPTVKVGASGIAFCGKPEDPEKWNCRQTIDKTLDQTKFGSGFDVVDVVVEGIECPTETEWKKWARAPAKATSRVKHS